MSFKFIGKDNNFLSLPFYFYRMLPESISQFLNDHFLRFHGIPGNVHRIKSVGGGCISFTYQFDYADKSYFIKYLSKEKFPNMYWAESKGLKLLDSVGAFDIPRIILEGETDEFQFLVMEFIDSSPKKKGFWEELALGMSQIHAETQPQFGLSFHNFIGTLEQKNDQVDSWTEFYFAQRLMPQLEMALMSQKLPKDIIGKFEHLFLKFDELIPKEKPSLLHGDFWYENVIPNQFGAPTLIDPAVYFGHREMDLAMADLFGGFSEEFWEAYQHRFPLEPGYEHRRKLHQLYPLLV
ncbi:MAG: fructosamine kinase family protein, partial [Bacteroidia bacterium]